MSDDPAIKASARRFLDKRAASPVDRRAFRRALYERQLLEAAREIENLELEVARLDRLLSQQLESLEARRAEVETWRAAILSLESVDEPEVSEPDEPRTDQ